MIAPLWRTLRRPGPSAPAYVLRVTPLVVLPALVLATIVTAGFELLGFETGLERIQTDTGELSGVAAEALNFFLLVIFSPVAETLLMVPVFWVLNRFGMSFTAMVLVQTTLWALLHSALAPAWGFVIAWAFFIFSTAFLTWQRSAGTGTAIAVVTAIHGLNNLIAWTIGTLAEGMTP